MKNQEVSKGAAIRHETELVTQFQELLESDPDLRWNFMSPATHHRLNRVEIELDGKRVAFRPFYELKPSLVWLDAQLPTDGTPLLQITPLPLIVTAELSTRVLNHCKQHHLSAIDLNGRAYLRAPGLLVDRRPLPGRSFSYELEPRNIFVGKSARIVRCLLTDCDRLWTQGEIVPRTKASSGLVSRIVQHLISQGFAEKTSAREFRLRDPQALLDEWVESDRLAKRTRTMFYAGFINHNHPGEWARHLQAWAKKESVPIAFTQWVAAWARHPFTEPTVCSAYVSRLPEARTLEQLQLRPVAEGGNVWLHIPEDEGILAETQNRNDLTLVTDAQIYLDLQRTGLRGPDAAAALREQHDFCRR